VGTRPVTVLTVDDQQVFRRAARKLIAATPGFLQVGEAASGSQAVKLASELRPDMVLVDVRMPGMDGLETTRRLSETTPEAVVVLISMEEVPELPSAIDSVGAATHLRKQSLSTEALQEVWKKHGASAR
jgi:two-component system, NarL family, invasion response regulator UvrY